MPDSFAVSTLRLFGREIDHETHRVVGESMRRTVPYEFASVLERLRRPAPRLSAEALETLLKAVGKSPDLIQFARDDLIRIVALVLESLYWPEEWCVSQRLRRLGGILDDRHEYDDQHRPDNSDDSDRGHWGASEGDPDDDPGENWLDGFSVETPAKTAWYFKRLRRVLPDGAEDGGPVEYRHDLVARRPRIPKPVADEVDTARRALRSLPSGHRKVFELRWQQNLSCLIRKWGLESPTGPTPGTRPIPPKVDDAIYRYRLAHSQEQSHKARGPRSRDSRPPVDDEQVLALLRKLHYADPDKRKKTKADIVTEVAQDLGIGESKVRLAARKYGLTRRTKTGPMRRKAGR